MTRAIFLDIGEVLVGLDYELPLRRLRELTGLQPEEILSRLAENAEIRLYETGKLTTHEFFSRMLRLLEVPPGFSARELAELWKGVFRFHSRQPGELLSSQLFETLKARYCLIALSNINELHFEFLRRNLPLIDAFDDYALSFRIGSMKPDVAIFRAALEIGGLEAEEAFFVDDRPENVEAARRLGIPGEVFVTESELRTRLRSLKLL